MLKQVVYYGFTVLFNRIFGLLPLKKNRVLFLSDVREEISGNFRAVYDAIPPGYEIRTSLKADRRIRRSPGEFLKLCHDLATAGYIFLDDFSSATAYIHVRKGQELVQLWHGSGAYKKFGHSRGGDGELTRVHPGYKRYTKAVVSSESVRGCFAEAFSLPADRVIATGVPRTDIFFDEAYKQRKKEELLQKYPQIRGKKVILFAPTYRGARVEDADYQFDALDMQRFSAALKGEYVLLIKWHPALCNNIKFGRAKGYNPEQYPDFLIDVSEEREVNDFLFVTDVLVTDYSSVIFDYALLKKPIVYFIYDIGEYQGGRGLYYPFEDYVYGGTATDTEGLIRAVREASLDEKTWSSFLCRFAQANDGHATERLLRELGIL